MPASDLGRRYDAARQILARRNQDHVLCFWEKLALPAQSRLLEQIEGLDFAQLDPLIRSHVLAKPDKIVPVDIAPAPFFGRISSYIGTFGLMGQFLSPIIFAPVVLLLGLNNVFLVAGAVPAIVLVLFLAAKRK